MVRGEVMGIEETKRRLVSDWMERADASLYDTLYLPLQGRSLNAFVFPVGSGRKTFNDTNMFQAGLLPSPHCMFVDEIKCLFQNDSVVVPVSSVWYRYGRYRFMVNNKIYREGHLDTVADPVAMFVDETERKNAISRNLHKLMRRKLSTPILIEQQESFRVQIDFDDALEMANAPASLRIYLEGLIYRSVV